MRRLERLINVIVLNFLLILAFAYLVLGLAFAAAFVAWGVKRIDPAATHGTWGFRLLILPGAAFLWPLLFHRWRSGIRHPPEERTAHRLRARNVTPNKAE